MNWSDADAVHFHPWVGQDYESGIHGKRVLVLGESHYGKPHEEEDPLFTCRVVESYSSGEFHDGKSRVFTVVARLLLGEKWAKKSECRAFWNSVAFSNFLQEFAGASSREMKGSVDWDRGRAAYQQIIETLEPDVVLVLGKRLEEKARLVPLKGEHLVWVKHPSGGMRYSEAMPKVLQALTGGSGRSEFVGETPENEIFIPFREEDLLPERGRFYFQLVHLVDRVTQTLGDEPFVSTRGLRTGGRLGSYGRHLRIHGFAGFLHVSPRRWFRTEITPLWLSVRDSDFKTASEARELLHQLRGTNPPKMYLFDGVPHLPIHLQTGLGLEELVKHTTDQILDMTAGLSGAS